MTTTILAHFDGKVLVPDEPVELPVGQPLRLHMEPANGNPPRFNDLLRFAADLPNAPTDMAAEHDHYLYGTPKR